MAASAMAKIVDLMFRMDFSRNPRMDKCSAVQPVHSVLSPA